MPSPPRLAENDDRFTIGPSTIAGAGSGLFATVDLPAGAEFEVIGVLIPRETSADYCTRYADHYKFRVGDELLIPVGFGALVNHSAHPNLEKVIADGRVWFRVREDVSAGEELYFEYSEEARAAAGDV